MNLNFIVKDLKLSNNQEAVFKKDVKNS